VENPESDRNPSRISPRESFADEPLEDSGQPQWFATGRRRRCNPKEDSEPGVIKFARTDPAIVEFQDGSEMHRLNEILALASERVVPSVYPVHLLS
jgi:hypothetical protein